MRAFVVRPFGKRQGVDFERVHVELIKPALKAAKIDGDTTLEIMEQGDIREDMFRLLVGADLVIADISIHNANVFYELGIRHAVLDRHTLLGRPGERDHLRRAHLAAGPRGEKAPARIGSGARRCGKQPLIPETTRAARAIRGRTRLASLPSRDVIRTVPDRHSRDIHAQLPGDALQGALEALP